MKDDKPLNLNDPDHVDPILEEIWQIRREISDRFNGDMDAIGCHYQEQARLHAERVPSRAPQKARRKSSRSAPKKV
ncbi:MAG TPA: hypothetical protein VGB66_08035 [Longimicrobium sp.]|jgi:hypothetical protein